MTRPFGFLLLTLVLLAGACQKSDPPEPDCEASTILDRNLYETAPDDPFEFVRIELQDDCLRITFAASGCDGSTWTVQLIDAEAILESYPVQRRLRFSLLNQEACDAVITRSMSFDLTPIQIDRYDRIILNIDGYSGEKITYTY